MSLFSFLGLAQPAIVSEVLAEAPVGTETPAAAAELQPSPSALVRHRMALKAAFEAALPHGLDAALIAVECASLDALRRGMNQKARRRIDRYRNALEHPEMFEAAS